MHIINVWVFSWRFRVSSCPQVEIPEFIKTNNIISLAALYQKLNSGNCHGLVCTQLLVVFKLHFGGDSVTSKNTMSEFSKINFSIKVPSKSHDIIKFEAITELIKGINSLLQKNI